jgi:hypothetical protein
VDLDALAAAIDAARATGDHGVLYDELTVQGWRRPSRKVPTRAQILDLVTVDPITGCWLWDGRLNDAGYGLWRGRARIASPTESSSARSPEGCTSTTCAASGTA